MPRGGQGGRGGFGRGKPAKFSVPWDDDPDLKIETKPSELFPRIQPPLAEPPTRSERTQVARYRTLRDRIHEGPLYAVLSEDALAGKREADSAAVFNPFEGMDTYTQKYRKRRERIPRLDTRPYVIRFFPKELWPTLDPSQYKNQEPTRKRKRLQIAPRGKRSRMEELEEEEAEQKGTGDEDETKKGDAEDGEDVQEDEERDTDFEDDEDENDDYNAENYFDDGEEDYDDGGGGGYDAEYD